FDTIQVHRDVADVSGQQRARAVGGNGDGFGGGGAVELQRIVARLALDDVAAVAGVPDERVVAVAEQRGIVAGTAGHDVGAVAAHQIGGARRADDRVVAGTAVYRQGDLAGIERRGIDRVVAVVPLHNQLVERRFGAAHRYLRGKTVDDN